ncbi:MAG: hypothetical protein EOO09_14780 [Chitinophagaceae bacterium]|nr:MAG: hypothetical protein EOO09_14780 [Chitinophagaceae bacterium]
MFIYYQIRNHHYRTEAVPAVTCPLCNHRGRMQMSILQKYTWLAGPMAPSAKYAIAWCENCNQYIPRVKWTDEMDTTYVQLKQGLRTPARLYRGLWVLPLLLVLLVGGILAAISISSGNSRANQAFVLDATLHPKPGDIFQVTHSAGQENFYTWYKVSRITADSVYMQEAKEHAVELNDLDDIPATASDFQSSEKSFSLAETRSLDGMFAKDENGQRAFDLVFGVWRDGKLHKKY